MDPDNIIYRIGILTGIAVTVPVQLRLIWAVGAFLEGRRRGNEGRVLYRAIIESSHRQEPLELRSGRGREFE